MRAKIPFFNKKTRELKFEAKTVYCAGLAISDKTGKDFPLYWQDKLDYHADIRLNNPKVGVVVSGVFFAITTYEGLRDRADEIVEKAKTLDFELGANELLARGKK